MGTRLNELPVSWPAEPPAAGERAETNAGRESWAEPFTGTVPILAAKERENGTVSLGPGPLRAGRGQAHFSARNGPKNEPVPRGERWAEVGPGGKAGNCAQGKARRNGASPGTPRLRFGLPRARGRTTIEIVRFSEEPRGWGAIVCAWRCPRPVMRNVRSPFFDWRA